MASLFDILVANMWNRLADISKPKFRGRFAVGYILADGKLTRKLFYIPTLKRTEHLVVIGKTGSGKTYFIWSLARQGISAGEGLIYFDFHGDSIPFLLSLIAEEEKRKGLDLSSKLIVIRPGDANRVVGINVLSCGGGEHEIFAQAAAVTAILKERWGMEHFGPRTEELLRNSLFVLIAKHQTLLELVPFLSDPAFRISCVQGIGNSDVREYFQVRFESLSDAMKAVMRDPILNKVSEFVSDPHFKFILGQRKSTFSFEDALNTGKIILVDLQKGRLGRHAATLGSLILAQIRPAVFTRRSRELFTIYADEVQNLLTTDFDFESFLAEFRKFGVSICLSTQFWDQLPKRLQAAAEAIGTHIFFQLSASDAQRCAAMLDGGKPLQELLKNLPKRHLVIKTGHYPWQQLRVPDVQPPRTDFSDLLERSQRLYATPREEVVAEIEARRANQFLPKETLDGWD